MENASDQRGNSGTVIGFVSDRRSLNGRPAIQIDQSRASSYSGLRNARIQSVNNSKIQGVLSSHGPHLPNLHPLSVLRAY